MAYTINLTDGTVFATINDGTITQIASGTPSVPLITLVGKNYAGYGEFLDENFVHLLESGSNTIAPTSPLTGQLWYDSTNTILKIYSGTGFKSITGSTSSASAPTTTVIAGDLWFDSSNQQLKVYTGAAWLVVGPGYTSAQGTSGAIPETILDSLGGTKYITSLYVNNTRVGVVYDGASFTPQSSLQAAFSTIFPGLTLSASVSGAVFAGTLQTAAQPNITSVGTLISLAVTGNISGGNVLGGANVNATTHTGTTVSVTGNITGGNVLGGANVNATTHTGTTVSVSGNVTGGNLNAGTGNMSTTGNVQAGNLLTTGLISSAGNITTSATGNIATGNISITGVYSGNGSGLTGLGALAVGSIANGTSTIGISGSGGNGVITIGGTSNVAVFTTTTAYFIGNANVTGIEKSGTNAIGNIGSSANYFNTVFAATHNGVTVSATGNVTGANVNAAVLSATGAVTFSGTTDSIGIGNSQTTGTLALGAAVQTGTLTIGQSTDSQTTNIQTGATASAKTKAINVGTGGLAGSTTTIAIGPVTATTAAATATFNTATTVAIANTSGTALSVAGNITGGNIAATGHTGSTVSVTGTITGGNLAVGSGTISTSGNITGGNVLGGANVNATTHTGSTVSVTGNVTGGNVLGGANVNATTHTGATVSVSGNITAATVNIGSTGSGKLNVYSSGVVQSYFANTSTTIQNQIMSQAATATGVGTEIYDQNGVDATITPFRVASNAGVAAAKINLLAVNGAGTLTVGYASGVTAIANGGTSGTGNIGASGAGFNTVFALATSAQYADLAERYAADELLEPGTVVDLGGTHEITQSQQDLSDAVFGVISTSAAYMMNSSAGSDATHPLVAIAGRVPVKVIGTVQKGNRLVSAGNGVARAAKPGEATWVNVIGRALENKDSTELGMIEVTVSVK